MLSDPRQSAYCLGTPSNSAVCVTNVSVVKISRPAVPPALYSRSHLMILLRQPVNIVDESRCLGIPGLCWISRKVKCSSLSTVTCLLEFALVTSSGRRCVQEDSGGCLPRPSLLHFAESCFFGRLAFWNLSVSALATRSTTLTRTVSWHSWPKEPVAPQ